MKIDENNLESFIENFILNDIKILKAFPILIKFKKDIVFTDEIINHYIDNHTLEYKDKPLIYEIPKNVFSQENYLKLFFTAVKKSPQYYDIPYIREISNENFGIGLIIFETTSHLHIDVEKLTKSQYKQVVNMTIKKLNKKNSFLKMRGLPSSLILSVIEHFINRPDKINKTTAENLIKITFDHEKCFELYDIISNKHPSIKSTFIERWYKDSMYKYILHSIDKHGLSTVVDNIINVSNIDEDTFKNLKLFISKRQCSNYAVRLLLNILNKHKRIETNVYDSKIVLYSESFLSYHINNVIKIFSDLMNYKQKYANMLIDKHHKK